MYTDKQRETILNKYISEMNIIKQRTNQIRIIGSRIEYLQPIVEYKALQLRKIIEQIMLASLVANSTAYKDFYGRLGGDWNAKLIASDLERVNPDFFPKAVKNDYENHTLIDEPDSMKCEEAIKMYEILSKKLLHASNPFGCPTDYNEMNQHIDEWTSRIIKLLQTHIVKLIGMDDFLFVIMNSSNHSGNVAINWFERYTQDS